MAHAATNALSATFGALRGADDTIAAIATPAGRGAIALVRMSGSQADAIAARVVTPWPTTARVATLCAVRDPVTQTLVDRALVTRFEDGASFTGEQSVEISTHGGHVTPTLVLAALLAAGARQALPGEFTRRALINGTLDLAQAEAIGDVIDATSRVAHRAALDTLDGGLSRRVLALRDALLEVEALIAYDIDFPEEDDGPIAPERIHNATTRAHAAIEALLSTAPAGELVRNGALVVIAGPPNAGKSSLFNALLGDARALVTPVPGTTRDAIEAVIDGRRWPLRLVDTAGLRESTDMLEQLGIEVSERYLRRAEAILACGERLEDIEATVVRVSSIASAPVIRVLTKADHAPPDESNASNAVSTSAETGIGLTALLATVEDAISTRHGAPSLDAPVLTRARHVAALRQARGEIENFMNTWSAGTLPPIVAAVHLRAAVSALEELVGAVDIEDVLERVFRTFCVGK
jgi:tRNA modification GTPase